jgi:hypothetical protein
MRLDLKKRVVASVVLGLAWAHFARAGAPVGVRVTLAQTGARASVTDGSGTGAPDWRRR